MRALSSTNNSPALDSDMRAINKVLEQLFVALARDAACPKSALEVTDMAVQESADADKAQLTSPQAARTSF